MKCLLHNISAYYIQFSTLTYEVRGPVMSILSIQQYYKYWIRYVFQRRDIHTGICVTWRCQGNQLPPPPPHQYPFYVRIIFLWILNWRGANKNCVQSGGKGCIDIKGWFKPTFPFFITWLLRILKFLTPVVDFGSPSNAIAKLRPCTVLLKCVFCLIH